MEQPQRLLRQISKSATRFSERRGVLERDEDTSYLTLDGLKEDPLKDIHSHSVTYRVAIGPQRGRKVFTLQTIPPQPEPASDNARVAKLNGFIPHAGVAAHAINVKSWNGSVDTSSGRALQKSASPWSLADQSTRPAC